MLLETLNLLLDLGGGEASLLTPGASTIGFGWYLGSSQIDTSSSSSVDGSAPSSENELC
ncbi:hypothetical protein IHE45_16G057900 [Dioscorea alata]|uniref:Uncharacterized protein n=1 Tax=Dioscorea alata TaxID=55571 RepID=A0ACB7UHL7_DIOAL|nr:hypothetical protein IHE45_16G057900 [Dioscorea alata]